MNRTRRLIQILLAVAVLATIVLVVKGVRSHQPDPMPADFTADGLGMEQTIFDGDNRRIIELKSSSSRKGEQDRIYMQNLDARLLKQGRLSEDIHVQGEEGYVENNYHNLLVRKNAKISSRRFVLESDQFFLKDRAILRTKKPVAFSLRDLKGTAAKGMAYYLKQNLIKLFDTRGVHMRQGREYKFQAGTLWFVEKERKLILEKAASIKGPESDLEGDWISIAFDDDIEIVRETRCQGRAHMRVESPGDPPLMRDLRCGVLTAQHDENGDISKLSLVRRVTVHLQRGERHSRIKSELLDAAFTPGGKFLSKITIPIPGEVIHTGGTEFSASADSMSFTFRSGEIALWRGKGNGNLRGRDFSSRSDSIEFDSPHHLIHLQGKECRVIQEKHVFLAPAFSIHTEKKWMKGKDGVRATFHPKRPQPPFSEKPFFIQSKELLHLDENRTTHFTGSVQLFQDAARLKAESLTMNPDKQLLANGKVRLTFQSETQSITAWGEKLAFDPEKQRLTIRGKGGFKSTEAQLNAEALSLSFRGDNRLHSVAAEGSVTFSKDDITGGSDNVLWDFIKREMQFSGNARLEKKQGAKAQGEFLDLDLKSNNMRVRSRKQQRTSTVLDEAP